MGNLSLESILVVQGHFGFYVRQHVGSVHSPNLQSRARRRNGEAALSELVTASTSDGSYFFTAFLPLSLSPREIALVQFSEPGRYGRRCGRLLLIVRPSSVSFTHFDSENDKTQKKGRKTERKEGRTRSKSDTASRAPLPTVLPPKEPLPSAFPNPPNSRNNVSLIDGFWLHHTIDCTCSRNSGSAQGGKVVVGGNSIRDNTTRHS